MRAACFVGVYAPESEFFKGVATVNKIELHNECQNARYSCVECTKSISEVLGISLSVFMMLRSYVLRLELGESYAHVVD